MSKKFDIGVVLSVTTGKLLCPFDQLHEFLDHLTGQQLFTHQLPRAADSGTPYIYSLYPQLEFIDVPKFDGTPEQIKKQVEDFLYYLVTSGFPKEYDIEPMKDFEAKDPIQELIEMRGGSTKGIIPVIID